MSDEYIIYDPAEFDKIEIKPVENSDEITRLRADLAAVTAERDRMREALKDALVWLGDSHGGRPVMSVDSIRNIANSSAASEVVTEPAKGESNGK